MAATPMKTGMEPQHVFGIRCFVAHTGFFQVNSQIGGGLTMNPLVHHNPNYHDTIQQIGSSLSKRELTTVPVYFRQHMVWYTPPSWPSNEWESVGSPMDIGVTYHPLAT